MSELTLKQHEAQTEQDDWAELFEFETADAAYYFTSYYKDIAGTVAWAHVPIQWSGCSTDAGLSSAQITVDVPLSVIAAAGMLSTALNDDFYCKITIYQYFIGHTASLYKSFMGKVLTWNISNGAVKFVAESFTQALRRPTPRFRFQSVCNNQLYDSVCALNKSTYSATVSPVTYSAVDKSYSAAAFGTTPFRKFDAVTTEAIYGLALGLAGYGAQVRQIVKHVAQKIWLDRPFNNFLNDGMNVVMGCNKTGQWCTYLFNNLANFNGMPYIGARYEFQMSSVINAAVSAITIHVQNGSGTALPSALVTLAFSQYQAAVASGTTNTAGDVVLYAGDGVYQVGITLAGHTFVPATLAVTGITAHTYVMS